MLLMLVMLNPWGISQLLTSLTSMLLYPVRPPEGTVRVIVTVRVSVSVSEPKTGLEIDRLRPISGVNGTVLLTGSNSACICGEEGSIGLVAVHRPAPEIQWKYG